MLLSTHRSAYLIFHVPRCRGESGSSESHQGSGQVRKEPPCSFCLEARFRRHPSSGSRVWHYRFALWHCDVECQEWRNECARGEGSRHHESGNVQTTRLLDERFRCVRQSAEIS